MSQFWDYDEIFGKAKISDFNRALQEFLQLSVMIRRELGKQEYLLDRYISTLLEEMNAIFLHEASDFGLTSSSELLHLCRDVMKGEGHFNEHSFYERAKVCMTANPLEYQEDTTRLDLYMLMLVGDYMEYAADKYVRALKETQHAKFDTVEQQYLYSRICSMIGREDQMKRLNQLLRQCFLSVLPMSEFLQGFTSNLLGALISRDAETSKPILRLWLEEISKQLS